MSTSPMGDGGGRLARFVGALMECRVRIGSPPRVRGRRRQIRDAAVRRGVVPLLHGPRPHRPDPHAPSPLVVAVRRILKVDRVDSGVVRRCVLFRVIGAIRVVVNIRQRATRPELIPQVNVQVFAAGLRWAGPGTLHGQRSLQYPGSRGTGTHRAARRVDLSRSIVRIGHQLDRSLRQSTLSCLSSCTLIHVYTRVR